MTRHSFHIGFSQATTREPWRLVFNEELRSEAARHPEIGKLTILDAEDDAQKQAADVDMLVRMGVDALLISPKVAGPLTKSVEAAMDVGIPVFVLDRNVETDRYTQFIGGDNVAIGRAAGRYVVELLGGPGAAKGVVAEIWGGRGTRPSHDRHDGFTSVIADEPGVRIVGGDYDADWKQINAYGVMSAVLAAEPVIDVVFAHNDSMAYGAWLAAKDLDREPGIRIVGIDGIPAEGALWVRIGVLSATFVYATPGAEAIRQAVLFLTGHEVPKRIVLPTARIDADGSDIRVSAPLGPSSISVE